MPLWPHSRFRIASISKPLTAAAAAKLYSQSQLDVDADIQKYVPGFPAKRWPITTRQLSAHLEGFEGIAPAKCSRRLLMPPLNTDWLFFSGYADA